MSRFLYRKTVPEFLADVDRAELVDLLVHEAERETWAPGSPAERTAWRRSLGALADVLRAPELATSGVIVELFMPLSSRRCDVVLTGRRESGKATAVVIELKQWTQVQLAAYAEHVVAGGRVTLHPSAQVRDYVEHLRAYHSAFTDPEAEPIQLDGAAWLHDMPQGAGLQLLRNPAHFGHLPQDWPVFAMPERAAFASWLTQRLVPGPGDVVSDRIAAGRPLPSPKLLDLLVQTVKGEHAWRLLDEQRTAYFAVRQAVQVAKDTGEKRVVVVRGGPGTGKSVLAIQLLADAARQHWRVAHATGSKAFQTVLQGTTLAFARQLLKETFGVKTLRALPVADLFTTFAEIAKVGSDTEDALDLVVADEAHRLWQHRRMKYPNGKIVWLSDQPMIQEVIRASRVTAFFLDDNQSVRSGEIGRSSMIVDEARKMGIPVDEIDLDLQFRCGGSSSYMRWVDALFGLRDDADLEWQRYGAYTCTLADDVRQMDAELRELREGRQRCRIVAGYCWRWSKPDALGVLPHDLVDPRFGGWSGAWIEKTGKDLKPLDHQYYKWATQDSHAEQVGSIYSVQGFEFDTVGVIWGDDLVRRGDQWVAQLEHNRDGAFKKELRASGADPVEKLINVYRVLLTRGMRGTRLVVLDDETRQYLADRLQMTQPVWATG